MGEVRLRCEPMRVIAGTARGRALVAPKGYAVRPTGDRVRQATFNALDSRGAVREARVLDLFAGTGALGIEALSRGAVHATFVDRDRAATDVIRTNLTSTGFVDPARSTVVRIDVERWLTPVPVGDATRFDLVIADPPYRFEGWPAVLAGIEARLTPHGVVVVETGRIVALGERWEILRQQRYGGTVITVFQPLTALST